MIQFLSTSQITALYFDSVANWSVIALFSDGLYSILQKTYGIVFYKKHTGKWKNEDL
jgi:hypothetical protein